MVPFKLFGLLLLLCITITWRFSIKHDIQDSRTNGALQSVYPETLEWPQLSPEIPSKLAFHGRKTVNNNVVAMRGVDSEKFKSSGASKISNAPTWKDAGTDFQYVEKRKNGRKLISDNDDGFVAFNADYRGPRHHPPKNN